MTTNRCTLADTLTKVAVFLVVFLFFICAGFIQGLNVTNFNDVTEAATADLADTSDLLKLDNAATHISDVTEDYAVGGLIGGAICVGLQELWHICNSEVDVVEVNSRGQLVDSYTAHDPLTKSRDNKWLCMILVVAVLAISVWLFSKVPEGGFGHALVNRIYSVIVCGTFCVGALSITGAYVSFSDESQWEQLIQNAEQVVASYPTHTHTLERTVCEVRDHRPRDHKSKGGSRQSRGISKNTSKHTDRQRYQHPGPGETTDGCPENTPAYNGQQPLIIYGKPLTNRSPPPRNQMPSPTATTMKKKQTKEPNTRWKDESYVSWNLDM